MFIRVLKEALNLGYRHFDTAEIYGAGHSEELVGRAVQGMDREELFITTKVEPSHLRAVDARRALEGSLIRLKMDYVDLYLIHWPSDTIPLEDSFKALNQMVEQGNVRYLGVSNFDVGLLKKAQSLCETPIVTNQVSYGLNDRRYIENGVLDYCQQERILLTAFFPIKNASLNDKALKDLARKYGATSAQIALAWLICQDGIITIPKSSDPGRLAENFKASDIELTQEDMDELTIYSGA